MTRRLRVVSWTCLVIALLGTACSPRSEVRGIVLVTLDTTRADRLGCYGYDGGTSPNLDRFATESVLFEEVMSSVPVTLPSHATMFTGLYPAHHGVRYNGMFRLSEGSVTVAELLAEAGWQTAGFPAAYPLTASSGIDQGFETYHEGFSDALEHTGPEIPEVKADEITDLALAWFDGRPEPERPFFLWAHYYDPHIPYEPPFPYSASFRDRPYDGEIAFMDAEIGRLLDGLRSRGFAGDDVVVIVAADHGEGLYEHGEKMHANLVYQSTLRVPLLVRAPGARPGTRTGVPVTLADLAPTMLDYAGVDLPPMDAISLRPFVEGETPPDRDLYFESLAGSLSYAWSPLEGIRRGRWKYTRSVDPELFDLETDPGETLNLYEVDASRAADMDAVLQAQLDGWSASPSTADAIEVPLDPQELQRLASLGYVGGTVSTDRRGGRSPRELVHLETTVLIAGHLQRARQYDEALKRWDIVLAEDPDNRHALAAAAEANSRLGNLDASEAQTDRLTRLYPEFVPGWVTRGENRVAGGDVAGAIEAFREGLTHHPGETALVYRLAVAELDQGNSVEAESLARGALADADEPYFRVIVATCRALAADDVTAVRELERAILGGYERRDVLETEPMLEPLRGLEEFPRILALIPEPPPAPADDGADDPSGT